MTPLRDEAGLSAQDFIAAQRNDTPAALVMSKFTSVTPFFPQAIHVNPFVPDEAAEGLARALDLTADERRQAHTAMRKRVLSWTARHRGRAFLADLEERTKQPGTP